MPSHLVQQFLRKRACDFESVIELSGQSACSLTAAAIRMAECSKIPVAVIVIHADKVVYCFMSESFKGLGKTGNTLTVLSGEELPDDFEEDDEENESLEEKWTPRFSYRR